MATLVKPMCFLSRIKPLGSSRLFSVCMLHKKRNTFRPLILKYQTKALIPISCLHLGYNSSQKITDEILKSRISVDGSDKKDENPDKSGEPKEEKKKDSKWTGKNSWKTGLLFLAGSGVFSVGSLLYMWGAPEQGPDGKDVKDEFTDLPAFTQYYKRALREFQIQKKKIKDPSSEKLLPDPLKYPYYQPPFTLVLEMTGVLVHPDWSYGTGWRFKKRSYVDSFLQQVGPLFEVVIYTSETGLSADSIITGLDPNGFIMYRLYRDATKYTGGHHVKDLSCLNRDLSKVIFIDHDPKSFSLQPANAFHLKKWNGEDENSLIELAQLLRAVAMSGVEDVRGVLEYYSKFDDPLKTFKENQKTLQSEQIKAQQKMKEQDDLKKSRFTIFGKR